MTGTEAHHPPLDKREWINPVLTGEIREDDLSAFIPLKEVPIPYHTFGMVDMCDPHKEIIIEEKILLYFKYDNNPGKICTFSTKLSLRYSELEFGSGAGVGID